MRMLPILLLLFGCASSGFDCAAPPAVESKLESPTGRYIVVMTPTTRMSSLGSAQIAAARYGALDPQILSSVNGFSATMSHVTAVRLAADPNVLFIEPDYVVTTQEIWSRDRLDQRDLPLDNAYDPNGTGEGVHIYIIDTGIDGAHPDFKGRMGEGHRTVVPGRGWEDDHGHGTHVAGTAGGTTWGIATGVTLHAVKVLNAEGRGFTSNVVQGIEWATAHALEHDWPGVANMSLGGDTSRVFDMAVCQSIASGMTHTVAAGNADANACDSSPAHVLQAITTGACDRKDRIASFSNQGLCVDVFGPGVNVRSARRGGGFTEMNGTSMAAPHAAGVAALCLEKLRDHTPARVKHCIETNASKGKLKQIRGSPNRLLYARPGGTP